MNTTTGQIAPEPLQPRVARKFDIRNVTRDQIEAAYLEAHHGVRRPALRRMARALARQRLDADVVALLRERHEQTSSGERPAWEALTPLGRLLTLVPPLAVLSLAALVMQVVGGGDRVGVSGSSASARSPLPVTAPAALDPIVMPVTLDALLAAAVSSPEAETPGVVVTATPSAYELAQDVPGEVGEASGPVPADDAGTLTPADPGYWGPQLTARQVYGLALYVTNDVHWAEFARTCFTGGGENRGYVGAVNVNANGTRDLGVGQNNERTLTALGFEDHARVLRDPVLAMQALYRTYQVQGAGAWFGCGGGE